MKPDTDPSVHNIVRQLATALYSCYRGGHCDQMPQKITDQHLGLVASADKLFPEVPVWCKSCEGTGTVGKLRESRCCTDCDGIGRIDYK